MTEQQGSVVSISMADDPGARGAFGNVGTVKYRDTVDGVRFTAHADPPTGTFWIVRHEGHGGDTDGLAVARSPLLWNEQELNAAWARVRRGDDRP